VKSRFVTVLQVAEEKLSGVMADVRHFTPTGKKQYSTEQDKPKVRQLIRAEWTTQNGFEWDYTVKPAARNKRKYRWLHLYWKPDGREQYDCGFSGMREDCDHLKNWSIQLL